MNQQRRAQVEDYLVETLVPQDEALLLALAANQAAGCRAETGLADAAVCQNG